MKLEFSKYHGTGNDFIMIDSRKNVMKDRSQATIAALCNRHFGIGADGLIIIETAEDHDFKMTYFNADGNLGTMCGNGGRCAAAFARATGWIDKNCTFIAADGPHRVWFEDGGKVRLELRDVDNVRKSTDGYVLDTGSPHLVKFVKGVDSFNVLDEGSRLRHDKRFPRGINVNFVEQLEKGIAVRTFERGVENETLSCGTGVTASAIASYINHEKSVVPIDVRTLGGTLQVSFTPSHNRSSFTDIHLTGPARHVFSGDICL